MTAEVLNFNDARAQRSALPISREPAQPLFHVYGSTDVTPYEANVIGETAEKIHATEEKAQKESKGLREKVCVIDIQLQNLLMEFNHHFRVLAELGFPEVKPFITPTLLYFLLGFIFLAEIPLQASVLAGFRILDDTEIYIVALGMAVLWLLAGKAMATGIRRLESSDSDRRKEAAMLIFAGILAMLALIAMAIARQSFGEQQVATTGTSVMSGATATGLLLLQLAFFAISVFVVYISLPRNRQAGESRSITTRLIPKIMKLAEQREKYSSRYNAIQRISTAKVEQHKAFARRLTSEYFEELHTRGGGNLGQAAPWQEGWFPPLSLGAPLEEHPPLLQDTLAKIASFHQTK
ncbi:hypothetical protein [Ferribacterium limneticum]|uniref:hypothetical protein n=1 Tax=Ferribacterium limneticum TaxID=76259 RepID=UPI001CF875D7|nr:hypothetical protein [Ferribacterium limneticum]UCV22550.1 hypothetical protein KI613_18885 [Ferribacterium limneticum]